MSNGKEIWTIIGAGMGGKGLVAQLGIDGCRLRIHDIDDAQVAGMRAAGGLHIEGRDIPFAPVEMATTDLAAAVKGAGVLIVSTYGNDHPALARQLAPLLEDGQLIVLCQGHFCGPLVFRSALDAAGCKAMVDIAEMDAYPYMLHVKAPDRVIMTTIKEKWHLSALPASRTEACLARIVHAFPGLQAAGNMLETALVDLGGILHVGGMITNVGMVEGDQTYNFYANNMVPSVCNLLLAMDRERLAVAQAFGIKTVDIPTWLAVTYSFRDMTLHEALQKMAVTHYRYAPAPKSLTHRYLVQDVGCGLVPLAALARVAGLATPVIDSVIQIANALTGRNFHEEGRNLAALGLSGKNIAQINATITGN
ncbi:NAD/NADP octopine/nopaline dehydrogenase family protein [Ferrovibrio sp. MS7]|uniref:NAD/NADP-dependent octopine/nopaline dehydrogenase family protein n=1 Tax=Ferrovibrio plantarum TaxID=3119164 RepID=UPI003136159C